jgi:hypothetical protein
MAVPIKGYEILIVNSPGAIGIVTVSILAVDGYPSTCSEKTYTYAVIVRVAFSPSVMGEKCAVPRMPSSQPVPSVSPSRSQFACTAGTEGPN